jgi:hypothetical protein
MLHELKKSIDQLSGNEARTWLLHAFLRLDMLQNSQAAREEIIEEIETMQQELANISTPRLKLRDFHTVHLVCGDSPAGTLRVGLERNHQVLGFPEFFQIGPLWNVNKPPGREKRLEWLKDHINFYDDYFEEEYMHRITNLEKEIEDIPENKPIVLWTADNAQEQVFVRYILHSLQNRSNDIYLINTTEAYKELYNTPETFYYLHHTAEAAPEKLKRFLEKKVGSPLTNDVIQGYITDWHHLTETKEVLRIWKEGVIKSVPEDYFDEKLIYYAKEAQEEYGAESFIKAGRIIGETYGQLEGIAADVYLEYRLRTLIYQGVFEIKGIPKSLRHYSVKCKK